MNPWSTAAIIIVSSQILVLGGLWIRFKIWELKKWKKDNE